MEQKNSTLRSYSKGMISPKMLHHAVYVDDVQLLPHSLQLVTNTGHRDTMLGNDKTNGMLCQV